MTELSVTEYARHRGCSRRAVYDALGKGWIERTPSRKIDPEAADAAWDQRTARPAPDDDGTPDADEGDGLAALPWNEARALKETYLARLRRLEYRIKSGEFVSATETAATWGELARRTREGCMSLADRLADQIAAEDDPFRVHRLLSSELRKVLEALADETLAGRET
jgi:hypothetical protein